jgi:5'-3' exonuclease
MSRYDAILIDTMSLLYKLKEKNERASVLSSKHVYRGLAAKYLETVKSLAENYLAEGGTVYLLFDNPTSRLDLQKSFYFAARKHIYPKYKESRVKESKEFYNTLDLIRYYYLTNISTFACVQVQNLEADDLVKPVLDYYFTPKMRGLMVTNDYDWTRYLSEQVDWLPSLEAEPETIKIFTEKMGFIPTENSVIIYKSLFGDPADNIPSIITKNNKTYVEFLDILRSDSTLVPEALIDQSRNSQTLNESAILKAVKSNERQYRINIQLTSTIPVSEKHLKLVTARGRNSSVITEAVEIALGLRKEKKEFVFGNIKSPKSS